MFIDKVKIVVKAGRGGDGIVAYRREKYVPLGGPAGGDGGDGGNVIFVVDTNKSTLLDLRYNKKIIADDGERGKPKKMHGANGNDTIIKVPLGTLVKDLTTDTVIADLTNPDQAMVIAKGGKGGRGNFHFMSSRNSAPDFCESGLFGEEKEVIVELKLLADAGLVGFPSVGKSTFLSVVSAAKPEIAAYPFTTIVPKLGVVKVKDGRSFVLADLPGLIQGAHLGKGLGHQFLKHIERCRVIIHILDMGAEDHRDPLDDYRIINEELKAYQYRLSERPQVVIANKMDLDNAENNLKRFKQKYPEVLVFPAITLIDEGTDPILYHVMDLIEKTPFFPLTDESDQDESVVYGYNNEDEEIIVRNLGNSQWRVSGSKVEKMMLRAKTDTEADIFRLGNNFRKLGVDQALREAGAEDGDKVYILDFAFEFVE
ncbi:MAG: GTPase ObgE [Erysipelotrichaceae bacterium]|nr:GTPase ObgE [Erysipelotrichaceae bacterium]